VAAAVARPAAVAVAAADKDRPTPQPDGPAGVGVVPHGADLWVAGLAAAVVGAWAPTAADRVTGEEDEVQGRGRWRRPR
jgi:hypothetical protein